MAIDKSYRSSKFVPSVYVQEQRVSMEADDRIMAEFQHILFRNLEITKNARLLEIGGGPTVEQLISASSKIQNITFTDVMEDNLVEIKKWIKDDKKAFNVDNYFKLALKFENKPVNTKNLIEIKRRLKSAIKVIKTFDLDSKSLVKPFDVVSTNYCPESITDSLSSYVKVMRKIAACVKKDGYLVMTLLKNRTSYHVGKNTFKAFPVNEALLRKILTRLGFKEIVILSLDVERTTGHNAVIALSARRFR